MKHVYFIMCMLLSAPLCAMDKRSSTFEAQLTALATQMANGFRDIAERLDGMGTKIDDLTRRLTSVEGKTSFLDELLRKEGETTQRKFNAIRAWQRITPRSLSHRANDLVTPPSGNSPREPEHTPRLRRPASSLSTSAVESPREEELPAVSTDFSASLSSDPAHESSGTTSSGSSSEE